MSAKKVLSQVVCIAIVASLFASVGIENGASPFIITRVNNPLPASGDLAVFSNEISVEEPVIVGLPSEIGVDVHNLGMTYIVTWHDGDYTEYDFNQPSDQTLDIRIRIRASGDPTLTDVRLDGPSIASFDALTMFEIITIHDVPILAGDHTIRVTQASDSPPQGDDLIIDWLEVGSNRIEAEVYNRTYGTDPNPDCRGVDTIAPEDITVQFFVDDVLIGENLNVGSHSNPVTGGSPLHEEYFIPNNGFTYTSTSWVPSSPGFHEVCVEVSSPYADSNLINNRACITVNAILPGPPLPPMLYISPSPNGTDAILYWEQPPCPDLEYYLIYRSMSQTGFDFDTVWVNTLFEINPGTGMIDPLFAMWIDMNVTNASHPDYSKEYYYTIRAVNIQGNRSTTSNTVGYYIKYFDRGLNTFSLPLKPFYSKSLDSLMTQMSATSISWLDENDDWWTYPPTPTPTVELGKGYVTERSSASRYMFTGEPASMVIYKEGFGFDAGTRDDISAKVDLLSNVNITWTPITGADKYYVRRSNFRHGFFNDSYDVIEVFAPPYQDTGAATVAGELYYLVVPYNSTFGNGSSTYSIGVVTLGLDGNEMFGPPLKPLWDVKSADWYVYQIPNCMGIIYLQNGIWMPHFREFDEGVYDTTIEYAGGYELSVYATSVFTFVGW